MSAVRWKQIVENIRREIEEGKWRPGDRLPVEAEIAERWGVSRMTAHRAMNELQRLGLVIRRQRKGTIVASRTARRTGHISLLLHNAHDKLEMDYLRGIHAGIGGDARLVVCDTEGDPNKEAHYLRRMAVETDGILLFPTCDPRNHSLIVRLVEQGAHIVCVDRYMEGVPVDAFVTDNYTCTLEALRFLIRQGIYPIAHLTQGDWWVSSVRERYQAYLDAMHEAGASAPEKWCRHFPVLNRQERASLTQLAKDALVALKHHEPALRAVFCLNDHHLMAVLEACDELGWLVPDDLQILSFHDCVSLLPQTTRRLHRLVQQPFELGRLAAERMMLYLKGQPLVASVVRLPATFYPAQDTSSEGGSW
ncbi:MAG: hypothetical protein C4335_02600 [Armatimonadota bacterium]